MSGKKLRIKKKPGIERRPIEYILTGILILSAFLLAWIFIKTRQVSSANDSAQPSQRQVQGSVDEISWIAEEDVANEDKVDRSFDEDYQKILSSYQQSTQTAANAYDEKSYAQFVCSDQPARLADMTKTFDSQIKNYAESVQKQYTDLKAEADKHTGRVAVARSSNDVDRAKSYRLLAAKQQNEENSKKVQEYSNHIDSAISLRRQGYDKARQAYLAKFDEYAKTSQDKTTKALMAFRGLSILALNKVAKSCKTSADLSQTMQTLQNDLASARTGYRQNLNAIGTTKDFIDSQTQTRTDQYKPTRAELEKSLVNIKDGYNYLDR